MVSIVVPVYNVALYVEECLKSVTTQTYKGAIECVVVDDCGNDDSMDIVYRFIEHYDGKVQFKIVTHERNRGISAARNTGIKNATGEWIFFLDSDDYLYSNCIDTLFGYSHLYPKCQMVISDNNIPRSTMIPNYSNNPKWIKQAFLSWELPVVPWNRLISKRFLVSNNLYFAEECIFEDDLWSFMSAKYLTNLAICTDKTYFYRVRNNSIMRTYGGNKGVLKRLKMISKKISVIDDECLDFQIKSIWIQLFDMYISKVDEEELLQVKILIEMLVKKSSGVLRYYIKSIMLLPMFLVRSKIIIYLVTKFSKMENKEIPIC